MGRILKLSEESRVSPARFENFSDRPVNYFREIVHEQPRTSRTPATPASTQFVTREREIEKKRMASEVEHANLLGIEEGKKIGRQEALQELKPALQLLEDYAKMLHAERQDLASRFEAQLVSLASQMTEKILQVELSARPELLVGIVRAALSGVSDAKQVTLRIHPQDIAMLKNKAETLAEMLSSSTALEFRPDDTLNRGDCIIDSDIGSLDARLATQLTSLREQLETSMEKSK
jgi:flagellar assembly protein FliH